jgi:SAM-dependent methyltransferase
MSLFERLRLLTNTLTGNPRLAGYQEHEHRTHWEHTPEYWRNWAYPLRPSPETIAIYRSHLKRKPGAKRILVLGSTPEIRDLVAQEKDSQVWVADFSKNMFTSMLAFTNQVDPSRETFVQANWLSLPLPENFFDVIIGDIVLHQVTPAHERAFLERIRYHLKPGGYFSSRFLCITDSFLKYDIRNIVESIIATPFTTGQKRMLLEQLASWHSTDPQERSLNRSRAAQLLASAQSAVKDHSELVLQVYWKLLSTRSANRNWSPPMKKACLELLLEQFEILEEREATDVICADIFPVLLLRRA